MRYLDNPFKIRHIVPRIPNALNIHRLRLVVNRLLKLLRVLALDEFGADAQAWKEDFELVVRAAVEVRGRDDVVAGMREGRDRHELRGLAGRGGDGGDAAFEGRDALFEDVDCGLWGSGGVRALCTGVWEEARQAYVHDTAVYIAKFFEAKEPGSVGAVVEDIALRVLSNST